ncbi:MAG: TSUP family transporter [Thermaerobacter sp.]|nr:TSUP family transporter [Thermaerobacter sp.]
MIGVYLAMGLLSGVVVGGAFVGGSLLLTSLLLFVPSLLGQPSLTFLTISEIVGAQTVVAAAIGMWGHRDVIVPGVLRRLLLPAALLSAAGAFLAPLLPRPLILLVLEAVIVVSLDRLVRPRILDAAAQPATKGPTLAITGAVVGFLGGLYGIGGGFLLVPALLLTGLPVRAAVGTALGAGVVIALTGLAVKLPASHAASWPLGLAAAVLVGSAAGAATGAWLARRLPPHWVRRAVLGLLVLVAVRVGLSL